MLDLHVIRHVIQPHKPLKTESADPGADLLIVVHKNPNDPDDPTEWGHHIPLQGIAYRKEMWGLPDYASTIDMELRDLERYYARDPTLDYDVHPLAEITEHYFEIPPERMQSFAPGYVMDQMQSALPASTDGAVRMCLDTVSKGLEDVRQCLGTQEKKLFPCKGMTALSSDSVDTRSSVMSQMEEQTQRVNLIPSAALDEVRQFLTDRESELDQVRSRFVDYALNESNVPEIMRKRVVKTAVRRGLLEEGVWT